MRRNRCLSIVCLALLSFIGSLRAAEDVISVEKAWELLPQYQYGQDIAALLVIDQQVISAMASPDARGECTARLAGILETPGTTPAARQYVCMQLRQVGTPAQVPVLARLLENAEAAEDARLALEAIPGEQAVQAMRESLQRLSGRSLIGMINSLAARRDAGSVSTLQQLAVGNDPQAANAALWALGNIANAQAADFLLERAKNVQVPTPLELAVPLLRCAEAETESTADAALSIYTYLSQSGQLAGIRRAAMEGLLRLAEDRPLFVQKWFAGDDVDWRLVAAGHLSELSEQQLDQLVERLAELPEASQYALLEFMRPRRGQGLLPMAMKLAGSDRPELQAAGLRCLGLLGDSSTIPLLIDALEAGGVVTEVAQQSLSRLPRPEVGAVLLTALEKRAAIRTPVIEILTELKYYEAIDPLIRLAASTDASVYEPALNGLRGIADPDEHDVPRLVTLLLKTPAGRHRDEVERTITVVCEKMPAGSDRAEPVLAAFEGIPSAETPQYLSLLGRLGGPKARQIIDASLKSDQPRVRQAAVRAALQLANCGGRGPALGTGQLAGQPSPTSVSSACLRSRRKSSE